MDLVYLVLHSFLLVQVDQEDPSYQTLLLDQILHEHLWHPSILAIQVVQAHQDLQLVQGYLDFLSYQGYLCFLWNLGHQAFLVVLGILAFLVDQVLHVLPSYQLHLVLRVHLEILGLLDFQLLREVLVVQPVLELLALLACQEDLQVQPNQDYLFLLCFQLVQEYLSYQANRLIQVVPYGPLLP